MGISFIHESAVSSMVFNEHLSCCRFWGPRWWKRHFCLRDCSLEGRLPSVVCSNRGKDRSSENRHLGVLVQIREELVQKRLLWRAGQEKDSDKRVLGQKRGKHFFFFFWEMRTHLSVGGKRPRKTVWRATVGRVSFWSIKDTCSTAWCMWLSVCKQEVV